MEDKEAEGRKGRLAWSALHWVLTAVAVLFAIVFVAILYETAMTIGQYGIPSGNEVDWLMSIVAIEGVIVLMDRVVRRIRSGVPPFAEENAHSFLIMAMIVFAKIVLSVMAQAAIFISETAIVKTFFFSVDALLAGVILLAIYKIFKYGSTLQAEVQDLV
jgi:hypothetical protein